MFKVDLTTQLLPRPALRSSPYWFERSVMTALLAGLLSLCDLWDEESMLN